MSNHSSMLLNVGCGGTAGIISKTILSPFERIKVMQQTGGGLGTKTTSMYEIAMTIVKSKQGILGFWRGNFINSIRVFPSRGILFASNDKYKSIISQFLKRKKKDTFVGLLSGSAAGCTATLCTYPMDLIRTRIAGIHNEETSFWKVFNKIRTTEGFQGYYRGLTLTLMNVLPYSGICFSVYNICRDQLEFDNLSSGACAGIITGTVTFPIDTVRRLLQTSGSSHMVKYDGFYDASINLYKQGGVARFCNGAGINIIRIAPQQAIVFATYEKLKSVYKEKFSTD